MKTKIIITTFRCNDSKKNDIANELIEKELASCINLIPNITSIYNWDNKVSNTNESIMLIKTIESNIYRIKDFLKLKHPYQTPEIISIDFDILNEKYNQWFISNIKAAK